MPDVSLDSRGRLTLPKELRERYGDRYHIVELPDGIKLVPVADDPLDALREEFADVDKSATELREGARETALNEAGK
jgi:bifunctional DNA-binding transcriptional regulator/antitoxin component of YhaV-PrlF toxin-antitoxin module